MKAKLLVVTAVVVMAALALPIPMCAQQRNRQIAFAKQIDGTPFADIYTANPDGSKVQLVPLGNTAESFGVPLWSPDGSTLLISHTVRLDDAGQCCLFQTATVNPDGSEFNQLDPQNPSGSATNMGCSAWYPDSTRLLCSSPDRPQPGVFSIRASDGGDPIRLTTYPFGLNCNACDTVGDVSPDGKRFVFLRFRHENGPKPYVEQVALFVENTDGTGQRQLTPYGVAAPHERASARWSPDGTTIISGMHNGRLFTVHPDGTGLNVINLQVGTNQYFAFEPHWAPDGTRIIFGMFINGEEGIFAANPNGSNVVEIASTSSGNFYNGPDWGVHALEP